MKLDEAPPSIWLAMADEGFSLYAISASFESFIDSLLPYKDLPKINPLFETGPTGRPVLKERPN